MARFWHRGLAAGALLAAGWPALGMDYHLAPASTPAAQPPAGACMAAADLQRLALVGGDRVLLACGERFAPLRLRTQGAGVVRIAPAAVCAAGQRPVFDGRRALGAAGGPAPRQTFGVTEPVVQVFADDLPLPRARFPATGYLVYGPQTQPSDVAVPAEPRLDGLALAGATLHARTQEWNLETRQIGADGRQLDAPLRYPLRAKAGLFLTGKAWMLGTAPGWAHDLAAQQLTVQGAAGRTMSASLDEPLLQARGSAGVVVQGIDLVGAGGNALDLKSDGTVQVRDVVVTLAGGHGVAIAGARLAVVERVTVDRTGGDGVFFAEVARAEVRDSVVTDASLLHGAGPALAAINAHRTDAALIENNRIDRAGYIGIRVSGDAVVQGNRVADSCLSLSDCAAIYTWRRGRDDRRAPVRIVGNLVVGVSGDTMVKFSVNDYFAGIYLDEWTRRTEVRGNVVIDAGQGIYLHNSFDNVVADNLVLAPRAFDLLDLVDAPVKAGLAAGQAEPANRLQAPLLDKTALASWARVAAGDAAALRGTRARVVVLDGPAPPGAKAAVESGGRSCTVVLPVAGNAQLPGQVLFCSAN
jgi:parallel beta-helix repeat protein